MPRFLHEGRLNLARPRFSFATWHYSPRLHRHIKTSLKPKGIDEEQTLRDHIQAFSETTALQGCLFAADSVFWLEKFLYFALVFVFIGLTIRDVVLATNTFLSEPTSTLLSLNNGARITFPNVTVGIPVEQFVHWLDEATATSYEGGARINMFPGSVDIFDNEAVAELFSRVEARGLGDLITSFHRGGTEDILESGDNDTVDVFWLTVRMLGQIATIEQTSYSTWIVENETRPNENITWNWDFDGYHYPNETERTALRQTFAFYARHGMDLEELLQSVARVLCVIVRLEVHHMVYGAINEWQRLSCSNGKLTPELTWFSIRPFAWYQTFPRADALNIWYNVGSITLSPREWTMISVSPERLYLPEWAKDTVANSSIYIDMTGSRTRAEFNSNIFSADMFKVSTFVVEVFGSFVTANSKTSECSARGDFFDCRLACRGSFILKHCGCWPLSLFGMRAQRPPLAPLCPFTSNVHNETVCDEIIDSSYSKLCKQIAWLRDPDEVCKHSCRDSCQKLLLLNVADSKEEAFNYQTRQGTADVNIRAKRFVYPSFEEQLTIDVNTYMSNIGGILGLWIGASFLGLIHIVVFVIRTIVARVLRRRKAEPSPKARAPDEFSSSETAAAPEDPRKDGTNEGTINSHDYFENSLTAIPLRFQCGQSDSGNQECIDNFALHQMFATLNERIAILEQKLSKYESVSR